MKPPTLIEIRVWMLQTVQHVSHVEYFLTELGLGGNDPERPHDIVGCGNKFEWEVLSGFAVQYRDRSPEHFNRFVRPSLELHRCQYHHRLWNKPNDEAMAEDMKLGAVDAICSLLEARSYQGGVHTFEDILAIAEKNPLHKRPWMIEIIREIRKLAQPRIETIVSMDDIPNIGIPKHSHDVIRQRVMETRSLLANDHGYTW